MKMIRLLVWITLLGDLMDLVERTIIHASAFLSLMTSAAGMK